MAELNLSATTTPTKVTDFTVGSLSPDVAGSQKITYQGFPKFTRWFKNYKTIAKIKNALNAYATWVLGKGWDAAPDISVTLENIDGWGEDTINSILWNLLVTKKFNGDAFAQVVKDPDSGELINLIPMNPQFVEIGVNQKNRIVDYKYREADGKEIHFKPGEVLHLCNDRVVSEIHGVSVVEAIEWNIEATEEAKRAHRKMVKNNGVVRVIEVDLDDTTKYNELKVQWKDAVERGDVLILPKDVARAMDWHGQLDTAGVVAWLKYLDDDFYMSIGVPRVILGGSSEFTEASAKISYLTYEQVYTKETTDLEADLWNQLQIRITFNKPVSLKNEMLESESKNTGQTIMQPNEMNIGQGMLP